MKKPTLDDLITHLGPAVHAGEPGARARDGSRPTGANALGAPGCTCTRGEDGRWTVVPDCPLHVLRLKRPGPLPTPIQLQGEGPTASDVVVQDRACEPVYDWGTVDPLHDGSPIVLHDKGRDIPDPILKVKEGIQTYIRKKHRRKP